jgi:hypothetical protein
MVIDLNLISDCDSIFCFVTMRTPGNLLHHAPSGSEGD